jgi:hypothetical protein
MAALIVKKIYPQAEVVIVTLAAGPDELEEDGMKIEMDVESEAEED